MAEGTQPGDSEANALQAALAEVEVCKREVKTRDSTIAELVDESRELRASIDAIGEKHS